MEENSPKIDLHAFIVSKYGSYGKAWLKTKVKKPTINAWVRIYNDTGRLSTAAQEFFKEAFEQNGATYTDPDFNRNLVHVSYLPKDTVWFAHRSETYSGTVMRAEIKGFLDEACTQVNITYLVKCERLDDAFYFSEWQIFPSKEALIYHLVNS